MRLCAEPTQGLVAVSHRRPQICDRTAQRIANRQGKTSLFPLVGGAMKDRVVQPLGQYRVLRIFWGSKEPGAGCQLPMGATSTALIQKGDWCGSEKGLSPRDGKTKVRRTSESNRGYGRTPITWVSTRDVFTLLTGAG